MSAKDDEEEFEVKFKGSKVKRIEWTKINAVNLDILLGNDKKSRDKEMGVLNRLSDSVTDYNFNPEDLQLKNVDKLFRVCQVMIE
jgi:epoxyqueuosine reductase QueG